MTERAMEGQPADVRLVSDIVWIAATAMFFWGGVFHLLRAAGSSLEDLSVLAAAVVGIASVILIRQMLIAGMAARGCAPACLLQSAILVAGAVVLAFLRARDVRVGTDALDYLAGPAYFLRHPDMPIQIGKAPYLQLGDTGVFGYWIPYTSEYFLAALANISGAPLAELALRAEPAAAMVLFILVLYGLIRTLGAPAGTAIALAIVAGVVAMADGGSARSWGGMTVGRFYENKGLVFGIGLPALTFVILAAYRFRETRATVRVFCVAAGLCFISPNAVFLAPLTAVACLVAACIAYFEQSNLRELLKQTMALTIASVAMPVMTMAAVNLLGGPSVYDFLDTEFVAESLKQFDAFAFHRESVFGHYGPGTWAAVLSAAVVALISRSREARFLLLLGLMVALLAYNAPLFEFMRNAHLGEYRVFWRFLLWFPIILLPVLVTAAIWDMNGPAHRLGLASVVLLIVAVVALDQRAVVRIRNPQSFASVDRGHQSIEAYHSIGVDLKDRLILASAREAEYASLFTSGARFVVGAPYFLAWQGSVLNKTDDVKRILRAQRFVSNRMSPHAGDAAAFVDVVNRYRVDAVIIHRAALLYAEVREALLSQCMRGRYEAKEWALYVRNDKCKQSAR